MKDFFNTPLVRGNNIQVLSRGRNYFVDKGINVVDYFFNIDCTRQKTVQNLSTHTGIEVCEICGLKLFKVLDDYQSDNFIIVSPKRKLVFLDGNGMKHNCCYKQSECFTRAGVVEIDPVNNNSEIYVPTFEEFISSKAEQYPSEAIALVLFAKQNYEDSIRPFISYWLHKEIDKTNLILFLNQLSNIVEEHSSIYDGDMSNRIMQLVGIKTDKWSKNESV